MKRTRDVRFHFDSNKKVKVVPTTPSQLFAGKKENKLVHLSVKRLTSGIVEGGMDRGVRRECMIWSGRGPTGVRLKFDSVPVYFAFNIPWLRFRGLASSSNRSPSTTYPPRFMSYIYEYNTSVLDYCSPLHNYHERWDVRP